MIHHVSIGVRDIEAKQAAYSCGNLIQMYQLKT